MGEAGPEAGPHPQAAAPAEAPEGRYGSSRSGGPVTSPHVAGEPPAGTNNQWKLQGACVGQDQNWWFPAAYEPNTEARRICANCPVRDICLEYALGLNIQHGIWGGRTIQERRRIRADRARALLASPSVASACVTGGGPCAARAPASPACLPAGRVAHHP